MSETYSIEKAAYLLGIGEDSLQKMVRNHMIDVLEEDGEKRIPKREISRLFGNISDEEMRGAQNLEPAEQRVDMVKINDEELIDLHAGIMGYQDRIRNLTEKIKRLGVRVQRLKTIATGETAKFWERANAIYPELWGEDTYNITRTEEGLTIQRVDTEEGDDYKNRFQSMIREGIKKGHLPQGFLGIFNREEDGRQDGMSS